MKCPRDRKPRLLLIEDDEIMGESLARLFALEGYDVDWRRCAADAEVALSAASFCVVVSDIRLPDRDGGELFLALQRRNAALPPYLFMTGYGTIDRAVELLKAGAADYITKPFDVDVLVQKVKGLVLDYGFEGEDDNDVLGVSPAMRRIAESQARLARHGATLVVSGESGVGKEHVARLFHRHAGGGEFVAVNCAAIPETLIEAELFGYEKGAFTGAVRAKRGYFEQAHGGTLFLDEIGDMPLSMQAKLLRVLQDRTFSRLGAERPITSDFRLVCATHRDLKAMVESGRFREDLYYRIHVLHLRIPPLRERPEDIRWFARHFVAGFNRAHPEERRRLDTRTEQILMNYRWPGNVRELKHAVERACILASGPVLGPDAFFDGDHADTATRPASDSLAGFLMACERDYLRLILEKHRGHITRAAAALGITRKTLWEKMRKLDVHPPDGNEIP
jgi:DNA-binding NtrC family response regulator